MEQIKKYLVPRVFLALGIYIFTCAFLLCIQKPVYSGAVVTVFYYVAIYPPVLFAAYFVFRERRVKKKRSDETRANALRIVAAVMICGCVLVIYNLFRAGSYQRLATWQIIAIVIAAAIITLQERNLLLNAIEKNTRSKNRSAAKKSAAATGSREEDGLKHFMIRINYVSMAFSLLLAVTIMFIFITQPHTVNGAKRILETTGYTGAAFVGHAPPGTESLPDRAGPLGAYCFTDLGGRRLWVDVVSGEIFN